MMVGVTREGTVPSAKIAISIDPATLCILDTWVAQAAFQSRSQAVQEAVRAFERARKRERLAAECRKLDPAVEAAEAEVGLEEDVRSWPPY